MQATVKSSILRRPENWLLILFFLAAAAQTWLAASYDRLPGERLALANRFALCLVVTTWVVSDSLRHGIRRPFVFGALLLLFWPLVAPFHLWRTRRWRAFVAIGIFVGFVFVSSLLPYAVQDLRNWRNHRIQVSVGIPR